jgi:hypothetical protein
MPLLRVALFIALAAALTCVLLLREAHAQLDGLMLGLGSRVMAFPASPVTDSRTIRINGVGVELRTEIVEAPLSQVIGHYREVCATPPSAPSGFGSLIASIATRSGSTDRDGYVACVETGATDFETLVERLTAFSGTRNLADLGPVRYAYASRTAKRPDHETFLLTMWADASINLRDLLPPDQGDATGTDPEAIPRPRGARRILSAEESSAPSGVYVYVAEAEGSAELVRAYRHQLSDRGWGIIERNPGESIQLNGAHILSAENGGRTLSVLTHAGDSSATTIVTLLVSEAE